MMSTAEKIMSFISLVIPLNPTNKSTGGMVAFMNHIAAFDKLVVDSKKICIIIDNINNAVQQDLDLLSKKYPTVTFRIASQRVNFFEMPSMAKLFFYARAVVSFMPFDVYARKVFFDAELNGVLKNSKSIILDHLYSYGLLDSFGSGSQRLIYIAHNVESEIVHDRLRAESGLLKKSFFFVDYFKTKYFEWKVLKKAKRVIFISKTDYDHLGKIDDLLSTELIAPSRYQWSSSGSRRIVFLGGMDYFPNLDAVKWLRYEFFDNLYSLDPDIEVAIVGKVSEQLVQEMETKNFRFYGFLSSERLDEILKTSAIFISPINLGSGIKIKLLEALSRGLPVISTRKSLCGLESLSSILVFNRSDAQGAAKLAFSLIHNTDQLQKISAEQSRQYYGLCQSSLTFEGALTLSLE